MAFICMDCSYRGMKSGQGGQCPACGSFKLQIQNARPEEPPKTPLWRMALLVTSWATLLLMIAWKLIN
jgi:predicted ATP-dependent serine protease